MVPNLIDIYIDLSVQIWVYINRFHMKLTVSYIYIYSFSRFPEFPFHRRRKQVKRESRFRTMKWLLGGSSSVWRKTVQTRKERRKNKRNLRKKPRRHWRRKKRRRNRRRWKPRKPQDPRKGVARHLRNPKRERGRAWKNQMFLRRILPTWVTTSRISQIRPRHFRRLRPLQSGADRWSVWRKCQKGLPLKRFPWLMNPAVQSRRWEGRNLARLRKSQPVMKRIWVRRRQEKTRWQEETLVNHNWFRRLGKKRRHPRLKKNLMTMTRQRRRQQQSPSPKQRLNSTRPPLSLDKQQMRKEPKRHVGKPGKPRHQRSQMTKRRSLQAERGQGKKTIR